MGMRRYQCHFTRCEFKIDSKSKWLEHLAIEHRLGTINILRKQCRGHGVKKCQFLLTFDV